MGSQQSSSFIDKDSNKLFEKKSFKKHYKFVKDAQNKKKLIGTGTNGDAYEIIRLSDKRTLAVKFFQLKMIGKEYYECLMAIKQLKHKNVHKYIEIFIDSDKRKSTKLVIIQKLA